MNASGGSPLRTLIVGGGMITHDQILPSIYHLQRLGAIEAITICASTRPRSATLAKDETFQRAFPGQDRSAAPRARRAGGADVSRFVSARRSRLCRRGAWWWWPCPTISITP